MGQVRCWLLRVGGWCVAVATCEWFDFDASLRYQAAKLAEAEVTMQVLVEEYVYGLGW